MRKEYNKWYWKLYRWFKWEAKHAHRDLWKGIKNLWKWLPIIWKDRDWDWRYIFTVLEFKIKNTADYIERNNRYVGCERDVERMRTCLRLIEKMTSEYYSSELHDYWETKMRQEPVEGREDLVSIELDDITNDLDIYIAKYPNDKRRALKSKMLKGRKDLSEKPVAIAMGSVRQQRASRILFALISENIEKWWD